VVVADATPRDIARTATRRLKNLRTAKIQESCKLFSNVTQLNCTVELGIAGGDNAEEDAIACTPAAQFCNIHERF